MERSSYEALKKLGLAVASVSATRVDYLIPRPHSFLVQLISSVTWGFITVLVLKAVW